MFERIWKLFKNLAPAALLILVGIAVIKALMGGEHKEKRIAQFGTDDSGTPIYVNAAGMHETMRAKYTPTKNNSLGSTRHVLAEMHQKALTNLGVRLPNWNPRRR